MRDGLACLQPVRQASRKPSAEQLAEIDVLVFDIQDIGARFYTYPSTMCLAMEAAAKAGKEFVVLDRPEPDRRRTVEGPLLERDANRSSGCNGCRFATG